MPGETVSNTACPICAAAGVFSALRNRAGRFETYCPANHAWADTDQMNLAIGQARRLYPQFYAQPQRAPAATAEQVIPQGRIVVDEDNRIAIEQLLGGERLTGAAEIKASIITMKQEIIDLKSQVSRYTSQNQALRSSQSMPARQVGTDQIIFTIPEGFTGTLEELATGLGKSLGEYMQEQFQEYLENSYTLPMRG